MSYNWSWKKPEWGYWTQIPNPQLWQLVALSCDVEPKSEEPPFGGNPCPLKVRHQQFMDRYQIVLANVDKFEPIGGVGSAPPERGAWPIAFGQFVKFATASGWRIPDEMKSMEPIDLAGTWEGFDPDSDTYPPELDIGLMAWRAVTQTPGKGSPKQQIAAWLRANYSDLSGEAIERIATVCNWGKSGGKPSRRG